MASSTTIMAAFELFEHFGEAHNQMAKAAEQLDPEAILATAHGFMQTLSDHVSMIGGAAAEDAAILIAFAEPVVSSAKAAIQECRTSNNVEVAAAERLPTQYPALFPAKMLG
jgi:hypothetical protein